MIEKIIDLITDSRKCSECGKRRKENVWKHQGNDKPSAPLCIQCFGEDVYYTMRSLGDRG